MASEKNPDIEELWDTVTDLRDYMEAGRQAFILVTKQSLFMTDVLRLNVEGNTRWLRKLTRAHNRTAFGLTISPQDCAPGWPRRTAQAKATWAKRRAL